MVPRTVQLLRSTQALLFILQQLLSSTPSLSPTQDCATKPLQPKLFFLVTRRDVDPYPVTNEDGPVSKKCKGRAPKV